MKTKFIFIFVIVLCMFSSPVPLEAEKWYLPLVFHECPISPPETTISGRITASNGIGVPNVAVTITGPIAQAIITDQSGYYSFKGGEKETYTIIPHLAGYSFDPPSRTVTVNIANVPGKILPRSILPIRR
jgi:hypothetical protein